MTQPQIKSVLLRKFHLILQKLQKLHINNESKHILFLKKKNINKICITIQTWLLKNLSKKTQLNYKNKNNNICLFLITVVSKKMPEK